MTHLSTEGKHLSGPACGRILAGMGAEVIKIEPPYNGDWSRKVGPHLNQDNPYESSALFLYNNTGKKSVTLDLQTKREFNKLNELVETSDIFIEDWDLNFRKSFIFNLDMFSTNNSNLIELSVTPFGLSGPYAHFRSSSITQLALAGILNLIGEKDREPLMLPGYQPEYLTGINGANAIQIALWDREFENAAGKFLELSILETLANLHQPPLDMDGQVRHRSGHRQSPLSSKGFPPGVCTLEASDGSVTFSSSQWLLPVAPVLDIDEILSDPHFEFRDAFQSINHPIAGKALYPTPPYMLENQRLNLRRAPLLGEHNKEYL